MDQEQRQQRKEDAMRLGVHAALMRELMHSPFWDCYAEYLNSMIEDFTERCLQANRDTFEYHKGVVMGLRDALRIPQNVVNWSEQANRN